MSKEGDLLFEKNAVKERWVQYNDENRGTRPDYIGNDGPSKTLGAFSEAIKIGKQQVQMKSPLNS